MKKGFFKGIKFCQSQKARYICTRNSDAEKSKVIELT